MTLYYNTINSSESTHLEAGTTETTEEAFERRKKERAEERRKKREKCWMYHEDETITEKICITIGIFLMIITLIFVTIGIFVLLDIIVVWYNSFIDDILTALFGADAYNKYYAICNPRVDHNSYIRDGKV